LPVDPQVQNVLDAMAAAGAPPPSQQRPEEVRAAYRMMIGLGAESTAAVEVADRVAPGPAGPVPVRVYTPEGGSGPFPTLLWFHGGGFVIGDLDTADGAARRLCAGVGAVVVSVDYRLAPEHPAPAAVDDCWAVTLWVAANPGEVGADPDRIAVGGDSAGGNIAALVALRAREAATPKLVHQLLVYPYVDLAHSLPSVDENGTGYLLDKDTLEWFAGNYLDGTDVEPTDPLISPLYVASLEGVAPATVITAEFDPLRDEGEAYARRLADAGVPVEVTRYDGMVHGFFSMDLVTPTAATAVTAAVEALRAAF
jgi:acetyl esterase